METACAFRIRQFKVRHTHRTIWRFSCYLTFLNLRPYLFLIKRNLSQDLLGSLVKRNFESMMTVVNHVPVLQKAMDMTSLEKKDQKYPKFTKPNAGKVTFIFNEHL